MSFGIPVRNGLALGLGNVMPLGNGGGSDDPDPTVNNLELEDGNDLLLEDGGFILLE
jgi:hypothetical protein